MNTIELLAKQNQEGSYSVSMKAGDLIRFAFVDFYDDTTGNGYQRNESTRVTRGNQIRDYMQRCKKDDLPPRLFELTANARVDNKKVEFDKLDDDGILGILSVRYQTQVPWLCMIDGGTRLLGIQKALADGIISPNNTFDIRLFTNLSLAEEIAQFLLINDKQKRVRTDLSLRVVQRHLDNDELSVLEKKILQTVVPDTDSWKFSASRISGTMNTDQDSPWNNMIQMPGDKVTRPVKLQAFLTALRPLLVHPDLQAQFDQMEGSNNLQIDGAPVTKSDYIIKVLKNFWNAIRNVNPNAFEEPQTTVLWGSIGVSSSHIALAPIILSILESANPALTQDRFESVLKQTTTAEYEFWFTKAGAKKPKDAYPGQKGEAPRMAGAAGYKELGQKLEQEWRAAIHSGAIAKVATA